MRTPEQERDWLLKMAAAEDEALAKCTSGVLACSPALYAMLTDADRMLADAGWTDERKTVTVPVPTDVVEQVKNGTR